MTMRARVITAIASASLIGLCILLFVFPPRTPNMNGHQYLLADIYSSTQGNTYWMDVVVRDIPRGNYPRMHIAISKAPYTPGIMDLTWDGNILTPGTVTFSPQQISLNGEIQLWDTSGQTHLAHIAVTFIRTGSAHNLPSYGANGWGHIRQVWASNVAPMDSMGTLSIPDLGLTLDLTSDSHGFFTDYSYWGWR